MRRSRNRITALALAMLMVAGTASAAEDISKVNGSIATEAGQTYGDLDTVNGSINVAEHAQTGSAETVNGSITISDNALTGGVETVNGGIRIGRNVQISGNVETVNGAIFIDRGSQLSGGVETVNGAIGLVATQVGKGVETVNGNITVGVDSIVKGGIRVSKSNSWLQVTPKHAPRIIIGPRAVVEGPLVFEREVVLYVHKSARIGPVTGATARPFETETAPEE